MLLFNAKAQRSQRIEIKIFTTRLSRFIGAALETLRHGEIHNFLFAGRRLQIKNHRPLRGKSGCIKGNRSGVQGSRVNETKISLNVKLYGRPQKP